MTKRNSAVSIFLLVSLFLVFLVSPVAAWDDADTTGVWSDGRLLLEREYPDRIGILDVGVVWTTLEGCYKTDAQNVNEYFLGDPVVLRGSNFPANTKMFWNIEGTPGSCTPGEIISGTVTTDSNGSVCLSVYNVGLGDCGVYKYGLGGKNDNYHVVGLTYRLDLTKTGPADLCKSPDPQTVEYTYTVTNSSNPGGRYPVTLYNVAITDSPRSVAEKLAF